MRRLALLALLAPAAPLPALALQPGAAPANPAFIDRAAGLPVQQVYGGGWEHFVGGGVAALDCNADGYPDLVAAGGANPTRLFVNTTAKPGAPISFRLGTLPKLTHVTGAYPLDIDGDGLLDLFVMRVGANVVLKGGPDCSFTDASKAWHLPPGDAWTTAFSATWEKGEHWPTLAVGNYVDRKDPNGPFEACDTNQLIRPEGDRFGPPITLKPGFCALSMLITDWKRTGTRDLRVSNDRHYYVRGGYEQMWHLKPLREYGPKDGWKHVSLWGMGIASRDVNGDGLPDVMMTSMGDQLLQFNDHGVLVNAPYSLGTYAQRPFLGDDGRPSTGWHAEFADVNNDGRVDLFIAKGNVDQMPSNAMKDPNNLLIQQADGHFTEKADVAGVASTARSRGAALVDLNGDGRLDLVVMNRRAPMELWQNATPNTGNWVEFMPHENGANRFAIGAWLELRAGGQEQQQEVTVGGGHASGHATPIHFGLGAAKTAELRVVWPDGSTSDWTEVPVNAKLTVRPDGSGLALAPLE
ncbi:CRTAC1 family protein [Acidimangrovimonas pyrenivorans]|uniref:CRTAC1 family protein n=1 Tax=Acidimangrovimonas pyrenivorans TaxID=2030798 RepID=A0ABV7ADG8_9RHOB